MPITTSEMREFARRETLPFYMAEINNDLASDLEVSYIGLVDRPAIERNFQAFKANIQRARFNVDEAKRVIAGPAMIADMPLYRNDRQLGEYYVVFDKATIRAIVEKFSAKGYLRNFNLFHDQQQQLTDVTIFNSFISDKELGISPLGGFEDIADGSWFISAKVNNPTVWEAVKSGIIKGFSVEGIFNYIPQKFSKKNTDDLFYERFEAELNRYPVVKARVDAVAATFRTGNEMLAYNQIRAILEKSTPTVYAMLTKWLTRK